MIMYQRTTNETKEATDLNSYVDGHEFYRISPKIQQKFTLVLHNNLYHRAPYFAALVTVFSSAMATGQRGLAGILILAARLGF